MTPQLQGKLALVTGGSRGIGKATAIALAEAGADVVVNFHRSEKEANDVVAQIASIGRKAIAIRADVSSNEQIQQLAKASYAHFRQPVSIIINNAGIAPRHDFDQIDEFQWDEVMNANLRSAFFVSRTFLADMRKQKWGRIIFISSIAARTGGIVGPHYTASKAGIIGLMHYFAKNFIADGITSNAIAPALIDTDMAKGLEAGVKTILAGRMGTPDEVASACLLLATNGFMNGQTLQVDGGMYFS